MKTKIEIDFEGIEIKNIDLEHITLNLNLKCYNPNKIPAILDSAYYEIYLEGIYMGNGFLSEREIIHPNETKIVKSEVNINYENLAQVLKIVDEIVKNNGEVNIMINGSAYIDITERINFPFKVEKKINLCDEIAKK